MEKGQKENPNKKKNKLTKTKVREAMKESGGCFQTVVDRCGVTRSAMYRFFNKHPEFNDEFQQEKEKVIDKVEDRLYTMAMNGELSGKGANATLNAIKIILNRHRGYTDKQEIQHSGEIKSNKPSADELRELYEKCKDGESDSDSN